MAGSDVRGVSHSLFGGRYRLELFAMIANWPREIIHAYELAEETGASEAQISRDLKVLVECGLLEPQARQRGSVAHPLRRRDHPFWSGCAQLAADCQPSPGPDGVRRLRAANG
jgi:DNA-binding transcriptional ArsR family regulator